MSAQFWSSGSVPKSKQAYIVAIQPFLRASKMKIFKLFWKVVRLWDVNEGTDQRGC